MKSSRFTKEPATIKEQLSKLKQRGCIIEDRAFAEGILEKINYFRLANYFAVFLENSKRYREGTSFNKVVRLYDFDRRLRGQLLIFLEEIEISMRAVISNFHAHKYTALGYLNDSTFSHHHNHNHFMSRLDRLKEKNIDIKFVTHYNRKHMGAFPLWVMMELFSFGMLAHFFKSLHKQDKKEIAEKHFSGSFSASHLESWLDSMAALRNHCAHYVRLYANKIEPVPKSAEDAPFKMGEDLFSFIYVIRLMYIKRIGGESNLALQLSALFEEFEEAVDLRVMGFPENWKEILH
ncbi:MAG: Abi family protein [Oscillospiraceae bacterium]|jgi:abortive infection bacteriophage resistance protein|nr:Abi family protein [Oscillospiraceae bacterium]